MIDYRLALKNRYSNPKSWQTFKEANITPQIRRNAGYNRMGYTANQEFSILRKSVKSLYDIVLSIHPEVSHSEEYLKFMEYYNSIKEIVDDFNSSIIE
ncbi:MAG: hypothetical protein J6J71_04625 [Prevotella sp.]|nr:hypothetical protein [Prevotella sp.]